MFNFYAVEKANELRRQELLEKAAQERLAREVLGNPPGLVERAKEFLNGFLAAAEGEEEAVKAGAPSLKTGQALGD